MKYLYILLAFLIISANSYASIIVPDDSITNLVIHQTYMGQYGDLKAWGDQLSFYYGKKNGGSGNLALLNIKSHRDSSVFSTTLGTSQPPAIIGYVQFYNNKLIMNTFGITTSLTQDLETQENFSSCTLYGSNGQPLPTGSTLYISQASNFKITCMLPLIKKVHKG